MKYKNNSISILLSIGILLMMLMPVGTMVNGATEPIGENAWPPNHVDSSAGAGDSEINTVTVQLNETTGVDTFIYEYSPNENENFGGDSYIYIGNYSGHPALAMVQFPIPENTGEIIEAHMSLYADSLHSPNFDITAHVITSEWTEGTGVYPSGGSTDDANWNNRTTGTPWNTPGGDYNASASVESYFNCSMAGSWYSIDVTGAVKAWADGSVPNNGIILGADSNNYVRFASRESTNPSIRPKLTITYAAEIDPPVPPITTNEDTPVDIDLGGRGHGTVEHISAVEDGGANVIPFWGNGYNECRFQAVYTPDEVGAEGKIMRISVDRDTGSGFSGNFSNVVIRMAHTNRTNLTNTFANNYNGFLIEVFKADNLMINSSDNSAWFSFDLNGNFTYDSSHNLLIDIMWEGDGGKNVGLMSHDTGSEVRRVWNYTDASSSTGKTDADFPSMPNSEPVIKFSVDIEKNTVLNEGKDQGGYYPFYIAANMFKIQWLFNASELSNEAGTIENIGLFKTRPGHAYFHNLTISLAHSNLDSLTTNFTDNYIGQMTDVYHSDNFTIGEKTGWFFTAVNPIFEYNGTDNLVIQIVWNGEAGGSDDISTSRTGILGQNRRAYSSSNFESGSTGTQRNDITLIFQEKSSFTWSASSSDTGLFTASVSDNVLHITPVANAYGSGTVALTLTTPSGSVTQNIPVTINAVNDAPVISGFPSTISCTEDIPHTVDMADYTTDVDNDMANITFTTSSSYAMVNGTRITFLYPNGILFENNVTITATDPGHLSATVTTNITVTPVNDAPVISGFPSTISCTEDIPHTVDMADYTTDVDNDMANITFTTSSSYAMVNGTRITFLYPNGILFENNVTITATDPGHLSATVTTNITVTPVNDAPYLVDFMDNITVDAPVPYSYVLHPEDEETPDNLTISTDSSYATVNGTVITFLYPKGVGNQEVSIYLLDGEAYGSRNNISYTLEVTILDHPDVIGTQVSGYSFTVTFDMAMNESTVSASLGGSHGAVSGNISWNAGHSVLTFTSNQALGGNYTLSIPASSSSSSGVSMLSPYTATLSFAYSSTADTDGDGMPDAWEAENGLNPNDGADRLQDADGDGMDNADEYQAGTDPQDSDTDNDGIPDGKDSDPLAANPSGVAGIPLWMILVVVLAIAGIAAAVLVKRRGGQGPEAQLAQEGYVPPQPSPEGQQPQEFGEQPPAEPAELPQEPAPEELDIGEDLVDDI